MDNFCFVEMGYLGKPKELRVNCEEVLKQLPLNFEDLIKKLGEESAETIWFLVDKGIISITSNFTVKKSGL